MAARRKKRVGFFPKLILGIFIIYSIWTLVSLQVRIHEQKAVVKNLTEQVEAERAKNAELAQQAEAEPDDEYIKQEAQKQGLEMPDTRVFVDVSGN
ncbi:MAG: septum formation initiator family protein [Oscillospiraceae bacterium]|nr:septum formation initiator family protein [Oscillospiraceae bacterium]